MVFFNSLCKKKTSPPVTITLILFNCFNNSVLKSFISEIIDAPKDEIDENTGPKSNPEWDSLAHLCIIAAVEEKYKIKIEQNNVVRHKIRKLIFMFI